MRIKHAPAFVNVYVDGRIETEFPEPPEGFFASFKIAMIEGWVKTHKNVLVTNLKPGCYRVEMTRARVFSRQFDFDLFEV